MDVTCEKCRAEYEFDETLLGDKGTTVKCSSCNHVFRVMPPRREPTRPLLKLRFARDGHVESLGSLRDLQVRIRAGEIDLDDELGRDGFDFRKLREIPELRNFFGRHLTPSTGALGRSGPTQTDLLHVSETSMPPSSKDNPPPASAAKRTVLGIGPLNPQIPPPPRMPNVPGALPPPSVRPFSADPARAGKAPTSSLPTSPNLRFPPELERGVPISNAPTAPGARPVPTAPLPLAEPPVIARPAGNTPRTLNSPGPTPSAPVQLYLSEDEAPPERATAGSSKIWLYGLAAALLGGGAWLGMNALGNAGKSAEATPLAQAATPQLPAPAEPSVPAAAAPAAPAVTGSGAPSAPEPQVRAPEAPAPKQEPAPASAAPAAKAPAADQERPEETSADSSGKSSRESRHSGTSEPKDYGSWVARGDQLFSRGDLVAARTAYENAVSLRPTGSEANTGLGFTLLTAGKARESVPYFDRAASSGYAEANIGLGDAYRKLGQKSNALEAYEAYLERMPSGSRAAFARNQVDALKGSREPSNEGAGAAPAPPSDYQPAGELTEPAAPSAPSTPEPAAPAEPAPEGNL